MVRRTTSLSSKSLFFSVYGYPVGCWDELRSPRLDRLVWHFLQHSVITFPKTFWRASLVHSHPSTWQLSTLGSTISAFSLDSLMIQQHSTFLRTWVWRAADTHKKQQQPTWLMSTFYAYDNANSAVDQTQSGEQGWILLYSSPQQLLQRQNNKRKKKKNRRQKKTTRKNNALCMIDRHTTASIGGSPKNKKRKKEKDEQRQISQQGFHQSATAPRRSWRHPLHFPPKEG